MKPGGRVVDVVGAGAAAAEDFDVQSGLPHPGMGFRRRGQPFDGLRPSGFEPGHVLRATVVAEHATQPEVRQGIDELCQGECRFARRDAGPVAARVDVHGHVGDDASLPRGRVEIPGVGRGVHGLDEARAPLLQLHRATNLDRRHVAGRQQNLIEAMFEHDLRLGQLGRADADGTARHLQMGDRRALVGLGVRAHADAVARHGRLHGVDVVLQPVQVDAERRCQEVRFRQAHLQVIGVRRARGGAERRRGRPDAGGCRGAVPEKSPT